MSTSDPVTLSGEGEYNLNILKDISVTDSFLELGEDIINCQTVEPYDNCTSRHYIKNVMQECGCIPISLKSSNKVRKPQARRYIKERAIQIRNY